MTKAVGIDINEIKALYFELDLPVPYKLSPDQKIEICPISVANSPLFLASLEILKINKNTIPSPQVISMSYLQFLTMVVFPKNEIGLAKLVNIMRLSLGWNDWTIKIGEQAKPYIYNNENGYMISPKQFDDIRKIILYQNLYMYDDTYIAPELEKAIQEEEELRNKNIDIPSLERRIAIITAHTGISKQEQKEMTLRSHQLLFDEVVGETEFVTVRPISLYAGKEIDHWIYRKRRGRFDKYITSVEDYNKSMGGTGQVQSVTADNELSVQQIINNFQKQ